MTLESQKKAWELLKNGTLLSPYDADIFLALSNALYERTIVYDAIKNYVFVNAEEYIKQEMLSRTLFDFDCINYLYSDFLLKYPEMINDIIDKYESSEFSFNYPDSTNFIPDTFVKENTVSPQKLTILGETTFQPWQNIQNKILELKSILLSPYRAGLTTDNTGVIEIAIPENINCKVIATIRYFCSPGNPPDYFTPIAYYETSYQEIIHGGSYWRSKKLDEVKNNNDVFINWVLPGFNFDSCNYHFDFSMENGFNFL